jgi:hypothetical protein
MLKAPDFEIHNRLVIYPEGAGDHYWLAPRRSPVGEHA